jgi:hypothetical protein
VYRCYDAVRARGRQRSGGLPSLEFPSKPHLRREAQDFIRACLTPNRDHRPDVAALCKHPYLAMPWKAAASAAAAGE